MKGKRKLPVVWLALAALLLAGLLLARACGRKGTAAGRRPPAAEAEGIDLTYLTFDSRDAKKLEVRCAESRRGEDDTLWMSRVKATLFAVDQLDEDIRISAATGRSGNEFHALSLEGDALIESPSFTLSGSRFELKSLELLSSRDAVDIEMETLRARAAQGLVFVIPGKNMKLLDVRGVLRRGGEPFAFQAQVLRLNRKKSLLQLEKDARVEGAASALKAGRIVLQLDPDFVHAAWSLATGKARFRSQRAAGDGRSQDIEIVANRILLKHEEQGRLQAIEIRGAASLSVRSPQGTSRIRSDAVDLELDPQTQTLREARMLARGTLTRRGRESLRVESSSMKARYDASGELAAVEAKGQCRFASADFKGSSSRLDYDAVAGKIDIAGKDAVIDRGGGRFASGQFQLQPGRRTFSSGQGVKATLVPKAKSVLLRARPAFVTASSLSASAADGVSRFQGGVRMFQDDLELDAGELTFKEGGGFSCRGGGRLAVVLDGQPLVLRGQAIDLAAGRGRVVIAGEAGLEQGGQALAAQRIEIVFGADDKLRDVFASGAASFRKEPLEGRCQKLHWKYSRQEVWFRDDAEITRAGAGTTRGRELVLDLARDRITVSGRGDRSQTTLGGGTP